MANANWMIYGANGYTGELLAEEAVQRGQRPILAGRSADKLAPLAKRLDLEYRVADLTDAAGLSRALEDVALVLHAAGPFVRTSQPMLEACLATRTHYLDITGEVAVFENVFAHDQAARDQGIVLMSGVGFDVVPTDCMARYVAEKLPGATHLELAFAGLAHVSPGTMKSMLDGAKRGGLARRDGKLVSWPMGKGVRSQRFTGGTRTVMPIPWGDLVTAYHTTGIPNITTYMAYPRGMAKAAQRSWPLLAVAQPLIGAVLGRPAIQQALERRIEAKVTGPSEQARRNGRAQIWARAADASGRSVDAWLETLEGYQLTAVAGVRAAEKVLQGAWSGALTPAGAFGADFILEIEGSRRYDALPAEDAATQAAG